MKISNLSEIQKRLSTSSFKTVNTGFKFFGNSLFDIQGIPLDIKLSDDTLDIIGLPNDFDRFYDKFLLNFKSGHKHYRIDENSKFYLIEYHNRELIIIMLIKDVLINMEILLLKLQILDYQIIT